MADRAQLVEEQWYNPQYLEDGITEYTRNVNYLNMFGRRNHRTGYFPALDQQKQVPYSLLKENEYKTRYHFPDGLRHKYLDVYGTNNSTDKIRGAAGWIDQEIKVNQGIALNPVTPGFSF